MPDLESLLSGVVPEDRIDAGAAIGDDYGHDEALTATATLPEVVVHAATTDEVAAVLRIADEAGVPVTPRGAGTGLSGAAIPVDGGILLAFDRMDRILEVDDENHTATVQPGVTLDRLDAELTGHGLVYPVFPGEYSASLGGNVATNAGGMRAVKYGVTRHQVLGLEAVLPSGEIIRTGGKFVKATTGYDLTQLILGSEGTLAVVTEATLRLHPRLEHAATVLVPFATLAECTETVPRLVASGIGPLILEYIDMMTMSAMAAHTGLDLGVPEPIREQTMAYLVVVLESAHEDRLEVDTAAVADLVGGQGALDVYVLPAQAATDLIDAREKAFWLAKANDADDITDVVVPRAAIPDFMSRVSEIAAETGSWIVGCGHAGDGNVHLSIFQKDPEVRHKAMRAMFESGMSLGGAISAEHGIGSEKKKYFLELEDPAKIDLMRRIKAAFDPNGILNPGTIFD